MGKAHNDRGQSLLEFALLLPVLLLILAGVLDLGRLFFSHVAVTDAAAEGVAYAAIHPNDSAGIIERARTSSGGLIEIEEDMVEIDCPNVSPGEPITVTVRYTFTLATPFVSAIVNDGELVLRGTTTGVILSNN